MLGAVAPALVGEADRENVLAYMVDELAFALGLVEEAGLGELIDQLQVIVDQAQQDLAACRRAPRLS